jgi:hypothetical protein
MTACPNCGAPLPPVAPGQIERCTFCGLLERQPPAPTPVAQAPAWPPIPFEGAPVPPPPRSAAPVVVVGAAIALVVILAVFLLLGLHPKQPSSSASLSSGIPAMPGPVTQAPKPTVTAPSSLTLATLSTLSSSSGVLLEAPGMVGPLSPFDVVANYDWVTTIGSAWKPDAVLYRLEVSQIARDGTVNLGTGAYGFVVSYQFVAPSCRCQLYVDLEAAGDTPHVKVRTMAASGDDPAIKKPTCTLQKAFAALAKAGMPHITPTYSAVMLTNTHTVWVVSFFASMSPTRGGEGVVNAATCAVESMR